MHMFIIILFLALASCVFDAVSKALIFCQPALEAALVRQKGGFELLYDLLLTFFAPLRVPLLLFLASH